MATSARTAGYDADIGALERDYGIKLTRFRPWAEAHRSELVR
jgi:hypothetical protein